MENKCERCGYIASNKPNLIKHVKEERMCRPIFSTISHVELLNKLNPPLDLTCTFCNLLCKTKSAQTLHMRYYCHLNPNRIDKRKPNNQDNVISTNKYNNSSSETTRRYFHKNTPITLGVHPFNKEINWSELNISQENMLKYVRSTKGGIIELFITLHSYDEHKNIEWLNDKLLVYDGKGWTEIDNDLLSKHLGFIYSRLEEFWCDYQMDVRCGNVTNNIDEEEMNMIDEFMYNSVVDDDSVLFHCGDELIEYVDTLKTC